MERPGPWSSGARRGHHAVRHRRHLRRRRSEELLGEVLRARRDKVVLATKFGHQRARHGRRPGGRGKGRRGLHPDRGRRAASAGSAPTTSTCTRCTRPTRSPRSRRRWGPSPTSSPRQGALPRLVELRRLADRRRRPLAAQAGHPFISAQNHWSLLDGRPSARWCPRPLHFGARRAAVLPARQRPAHRQVPARPGRPRAAPGWPSRAGPATSPTPSSTRWSR